MNTGDTEAFSGAGAGSDSGLHNSAASPHPALPSDLHNSIYIIDILRFLACLMIFFYHCNTFLPDNYKFMTFFGEDMGNNLFFMISGFSLFPSIKRTSFRELPGWYLKRLLKIMPLLALFYILSYLTGYYTFSNPVQLFTVFVYPTLYWFVTGILVFYLMVFVLMKLRPSFLCPAVIAVCLILWILRIDRMEAYYLIGFAAMALGCIIRENLENGKLRLSAKAFGTCLILSAVLYMVFKYLKFTGRAGISATVQNLGTTGRLVYIISGLAVLAVGGSALALGYLKNASLGKFFEKRHGLNSVIRYIGKLALPVYMVQCFNSGIIGFLIGERIVFPLSFAVNLAVIWSLAILAERLLHLAGKILTRPRRA